MSKFYSYINEISGADLKKPAPGDSEKPRGAVLADKIRNGIPVEIADGEKIPLYIKGRKKDKETPEQALQRLEKGDSKGITFWNAETDEKVTLGKIVKTPELGGKPSNTDVGESAAAMTVMHYIDKGFTDRHEYRDYLKKTDAKILESEINRLSSSFKVKSSVKDVVEFLKGNSTWLYSSAATAEATKRELRNLSPNSYIIYMQSEPEIHKIYDIAVKRAKEAGWDIGVDKWNPGDVWIVEKGSSTYGQIIETDSLVTINTLMRQSIHDRKFDVVAVSLKQWKNIKTECPTEWYNLEGKRKLINIDTIDAQFRPESAKIPITKSVVILDSDPPVELNIRTFTQAINALATGELGGKAAAGGKVGYGAMRSYLTGEVRGVKFNRYNDRNVLNDKGTFLSDEFISMFYQRMGQLRQTRNVRMEGVGNIKSERELKELFKKMLKDAYKGKVQELAGAMSSKIQAMEFAIYANDEFFRFAYEYASSQIPNVSSPFLKVGK